MGCWEWTSSLRDGADLRPPLCSASANINLRKAQAVVNILLKVIRLGTWQDRHIPGSGADKALLVVLCRLEHMGILTKDPCLIISFFDWILNLKGTMISDLHLYVGPHKEQEQMFLDQIIAQKGFTHHQNLKIPVALSDKDKSSVTCLI